MTTPNNPTNPTYNAQFQNQQYWEYNQRGNVTSVFNDPALVNYTIEKAVGEQKAIDKLEQFKNNHDAFQEVIMSNTSGTFLKDKSGHLVPLMDFYISKAIHLQHKSGTKVNSLIAITINNENTSVFLTDKEFFEDKKLVHALEKHTEKPIYLRSSLKRSAELVRQQVAKVCAEVIIPEFAGWVTSGGRMTYLHFELEDLTSTHQGEDSWMLPQQPDMSDRTMEVRACAAEFFCRYFKGVKDITTRAILFLSAHLGMLSSLLPEFGCRLPAALYLFCPAPHIQEVIRILFQSFQDPPLDLSLPERAFGHGLEERKDEIALILDHRTTDHAAHNAATLQCAISTGAFELKDKGEVLLQSLPVIISASVTDLAAFSGCLVIDLPPDGFDLPDDEGNADVQSVDPFSGYRLDFIAFTEEHLPQLREDLRKGKRWAATKIDEELSQPASDLLGTLRGIAVFARRYYQSIGRQDQFDRIVPEGWVNTVPAPFIELSAKADVGTDIADTFLEFLRQNITRLRKVRSRETFQLSYPPRKARVLFICGDDLCISSAKVTALCRAMRFSRTAVLAALADAGVLAGRRVNNTTYLSRVTVRRTDGSAVSLQVLKIPLAALETFGETSILAGKEG